MTMHNNRIPPRLRFCCGAVSPQRGEYRALAKTLNNEQQSDKISSQMNLTNRHNKRQNMKLICYLLIAVTAITITGCIEQKTQILIKFNEVGLLSVDDPVRFRGVKIGKVNSIAILGTSVIVGAKIPHDAPIHTGDTAFISHIGLMGERQISISPGISNTLARNYDTLIGAYNKQKLDSTNSLGELIDTIQSIRSKFLTERLLDSIHTLNQQIDSLKSHSN